MAKTEQSTQAPKKALKRKYIIPDIENGGPSVTVEATSLDEALALAKKQKGQA
jgi:hypothetical protein